MRSARSNSESGRLNVSREPDGRWLCDIRVSRKGRRIKRYAKRFETCKEAVEWRDKIRAKLGLEKAAR